MKNHVRELMVNPGKGREYAIRIGSGLSRRLSNNVREISENCRVLVVTDKNVGGIHLGAALKGLEGRGIDPNAEVLPVGEKHKNFASYRRLIERLAELDDERDLIVVALGGGVVGDLAGFAASSYRRGIPLIQAPTTLLACVDSSVGGKTGFDLPEGKNLVGAFYQPRVVVIDLDVLGTLPASGFRSGMAEVIKCGLIVDAPFAMRLERRMGELLALKRGPLADAVERCCRIKARIVGRDERDTKDIRAVLNFGHTFAHAIEAACGYGRYNHGEAVGVGMVCAAELSEKMGLIHKDDVVWIERLVVKAGLPTGIVGAAPDKLFEFMKRDKKTRAGKLRFVLLERIGRAFVSDAADEKDIRVVLKERTV